MSEAPEHPERITIGKDPVIGDDTWYAVEGKPNEWFPTAYIRADIAEAEKKAAVSEVEASQSLTKSASDHQVVSDFIKRITDHAAKTQQYEVAENFNRMLSYMVDQLLNEATQ